MGLFTSLIEFLGSLTRVLEKKLSTNPQMRQNNWYHVQPIQVPNLYSGKRIPLRRKVSDGQHDFDFPRLNNRAILFTAGSPVLILTCIQNSPCFSLLQKWNLEDLFYDNYTRITLLVPSNSAWAKADAHFSESIDSILSDNTLTKKLIERHLLIDSVACSFEELVERTRRSPRRKVCMKGSELEFAQIGEIAQLAYRDHIVKWEGDINAKVLRPNLECTNGYIHLIDTVLIDDAPPWVLMSYVSSSSTPGTFSSSCIHTIFSILFYMRSLL
ncbi:FAS1 [Lepeophtheirus salmonis]|uniref:FAS1 n=1 Tax=Lepeophtheirus salmonis TaxID=72036 RepID=A0A7R8HAZ6_LEPSM|nr:FAS1 [Lepeophtheirus salmonis]CAF2977524.1 FAS1 [Lepeophtheirus salmonis]